MAYSQNQFQLTHLLQAVLNRLGQTRALLATGGGTASIIDTALSTELQDDELKDQVAFIARDSAGAGAAPEGEYATCSGYTASSFTLAFPASSFSAAVAAGDRIVLARNTLYPVNDIIRIANDALRDFGRIKNRDTSLTSAASQTEYALPLGIKGGDITNVEFQGQTGDADDNQWVPLYWNVHPAAPGSQETLRIQQLGTGLTIAINYTGVHPIVSAFSDPISEYLPRGLIIALVTMRVAEWKGNVSNTTVSIDELRREYAGALALYPIQKDVPRVQGFPQTGASSTLVPRKRAGIDL